MHKDHDLTTVQDKWAHQSGFCDKGLKMKELMGPSQVFKMDISRRLLEKESHANEVRGVAQNHVQVDSKM